MKKKFTIIICSYNSGSKIIDVVNSILKQKNYDELVDKFIIVDNNSDIKNKNILKQIVYKNEKIIYILEKNSGLSNARRAGVSATNSEWIIFVDDDNYMRTDWINNANDYIDNNINIGAFNGGVLPKVNYCLSKEMNERLEASLKVLACTHLNEEEFYSNPKTPFRIPIGAGLVIRTAPLKKLLSEGWLKTEGRKESNLSSGEDGEMSLFVKCQGYELGYCSNIIMEHLISKERLDTEYLNQLWYEVGRGVAKVINNSRGRIIKRNIYLLVIYFRLIRIKLNERNKTKYSFYMEYYKGYIDER